MDATFRNLDDAKFRKFKAKCAELGQPLGRVLSELMGDYARGKISIKLQPELGPSTHSAGGKPKAHTMHDLSDHIRLLHQWNQVSQQPKHHAHRRAKP